MGIAASPRMQKYFDTLQEDVKKAFDLAAKAREKGYDPSTKVEVKLAKNLAERVVGLISIIAPQVVGTKIVDRIVELEKQYGNQDWRVAMVIAHEVAQQKFCSFKNDLEAIEVGIRIGFAYVTVGVVSSPIEGFTHLEIKNRRDTGKYFCMHFAGPVRNAGGTAAAVSVIIGDYVRKQMGYQPYDPDENECNRCHTELMDYHERVTNLQYVPSREEAYFLVKHCPVEIAGDASEKMDVSNYKDLPRVPTNKIRSGYCLLYSGCIPLKAPKLWKNLSKWGKEMSLDDWNFLEEFLHIQHEAKSKSSSAKPKQAEEKHAKISPIYTYISDLVGGRPVISHPLRSGGFRLRYGRSRVSGYSAQSVHPATTHILDNFVAIGTQLKVERPGKAAAMTTCDTIEGPRVLLNNGDIVYVESAEMARLINKDVKEILYVGDVLINYGDFLNRAHSLIPPGYCEEWWALECKKAITEKSAPENESASSNKTDIARTGITTKNDITSTLEKHIPQQRLTEILKDPLRQRPTYDQAFFISKILNIPLHPWYTFFYNEITVDQFKTLVKAIAAAQGTTIIFEKDVHAICCLLGVPLRIQGKTMVFSPEVMASLNLVVSNVPVDFIEQNAQQEQSEYNAHDAHNLPETVVDIINKYAPITIRDKSGVFIGARMGRPEKGKLRRLSTSPHGLFPVNEQGGRLRSFQSCLEHGFIVADCAAYLDKATNTLSPLPKSHITDQANQKVFVTNRSQIVAEGTPGAQTHCIMKFPFKEMFNYCVKQLNMHVPPDLIKGVQGTVNQDHYVEHPVKAMLRAHHGIFVNKDGTIRYDASEIPITHFKPKEINAPVQRLIELGYTHDIHGVELTHPDQICEIIPQDILLPCCPESGNEPCDQVMFNTTKFIDDLLVKVYGCQPYYNLKTKEDLIGHYVIGLAPHTSAGTVGRIIGFTQAQAMYCHPLFHAANRRDCDGDELCYLMLMDSFLNFSTHYLPSSRGGTMDAPLVLTSLLDPTEVDDMAFDLDIAWSYPLEFYHAACEYKKPWDVKIPLLKDHLKTERQLEGMGFTHDTSNINTGALCSAYKTLPSMQEKVHGQMALADKIRAVDEHDVARIVIQTHFIRDTKGNLRKYSQQEFRCVKCNTKYRRPPLVGACVQKDCHGKILFTISEGSIVKYLEPSISLANRYNLPTFLHQSLELTKLHIEGVFGKEKETQKGLGDWFG